MDRATGQGASVIGREPEFAAVGRLLDGGGPARALILAGGPGIGKTTIWEAALDAARERGSFVVSARPSEAETRLSLAALADLVEALDPAALRALPAPQLHVLEVALLRVPPSGPPPDARAVATAFLNAVRAQASRGALVIGIDDVQWLDAPSADALAFAARRLDRENVRWLFTERAGPVSPVVRALQPHRSERLEVGALSLGAARRLLAVRLGVTLPRRTMRHVFEATRGNPLFLLEVGRTFTEDGSPHVGDGIPIPAAVEELLGIRVSRLAKPVRKALLAVSLDADLSASQLAELVGHAAVEGAFDAGVLLLDGERVRASHPLIAAVAREQSSNAARRELHRELASLVTDSELAARHLARAATTPDGSLAATVAEAAAGAIRRGAAENAVDLAGHALRLTPHDSANRHERLLSLAEYLMADGQPLRATDLLRPEVHRLPAGRIRARAYLVLAESRWAASHVAEARALIEQALEESRDDPALHATVVARKVRYTAIACVENVAEAQQWAMNALSAARAAGPDVEREVIRALGWTRVLRGRPIEDLRERYRTISENANSTLRSFEPLVGERHAHRGEVAQARAVLGRLFAIADQRGETGSYVWLRLGLCELALRAGDWEAAEELLDEWEHSPDRMAVDPTYERCRAFLAIGRGDAKEAERWIGQAFAGIEEEGFRWHLLEALRAHGTAALLAGRPAEAAETLGRVWGHAEREGVEDPGVFPVAPDLVEALVETDQVDQARAVMGRLRRLSVEQDHPWGLASTKRCEGIVAFAAAEARPEEPAEALTAAATHYDGLGLRFDSARCLLVLGRGERRRRKWGVARRSLEEAAAAFEALGSPGWAERARAELSRVGARRPSAAGALTPTEQRVVELASDGLSNKEIAHALSVSVHTVEVHLAHAFAKLGVQSRAQLARRLAGATSGIP